MSTNQKHEGVHPDDVAFTIARTFDAPRSLVWQAWTEEKRLAEWWGPKGCKATVAKLDLRPGGAFLYKMTMPDGAEMWGRFIFREIVPGEKLVFVNAFSNEKGEITRHPLHKDWPLELLSTIDFAEHGGKTTVTVHWVPLNATATERKTFDEFRPSMTGGWTGTMDSLAAHLAHAH